MKYLLDTSPCIEFLRRPGPVTTRLAAESPDDLAIDAVVLLELEAGVFRHPSPSRERARIDRLLALGVVVLPFDAAAARHAARLEHELRAQPIGTFDRLIAAVALARGSILVTRNVREFARVPGLPVEDWGVPT